jgi:Mn2+/Fe2+ NRAMP family transporter
MTVVFFAHPVAAVLARRAGRSRAARWCRRSARPAVRHPVVGLIGTTITPYMQLFQQSSIVERGSARRHYGPERIDAWAGGSAEI